VIENKQRHELEWLKEDALRVGPGREPKFVDTWHCKRCDGYWRSIRSQVPGVDQERARELGLGDVMEYLDADPCKAPASATAEAIAAASRPAPLTIEVKMPFGDRYDIGRAVSEALADYHRQTWQMPSSDPGDEQPAGPSVELDKVVTVRATYPFASDEQTTPRPTFPATDARVSIGGRDVPFPSDPITIPPSRPCYVCGADTGVTREGVPLCVGCR